MIKMGLITTIGDLKYEILREISKYEYSIDDNIIKNFQRSLNENELMLKYNCDTILRTRKGGFFAARLIKDVEFQEISSDIAINNKESSTNGTTDSVDIKI